MKAKDFRKKAKTSLSGKWGTALITTLIATILGAFGFAAYSGSTNSENYESGLEFLTGSKFGAFVLGVIATLSVIVSIWSIVKLVIGGSINLGYRKFTLKIIDGQEALFGDLFSEMSKNFGKGFALQLLTGIYTFLWTLLFIVPGIIKVYAYRMAPYILLEHPEFTPKQAITASKVLMKGNKWRLFCLKFSFIGWVLLGVITCGIALLWVNPYIEVAEAAFYRQIVAEKPAAAPVAEPTLAQ